jgi:hypothetical protein
MNDPEVRIQVENLVARAEAIIETLETNEPNGRWALTAFSRYPACQLLGIEPYEPYEGDLSADPAALLGEAATAVDQVEVPLDEVSWRLAWQTH